MFQAKGRHGCFEYDLSVKGGLWATWKIPMCKYLESTVEGWTSRMFHQLCWLFKERNWKFDNSLGVYKTALKNYGDRHRSYSSNLRAELDVTEEMGEELNNRYPQRIGVMRWSIEILRIDISTEVSCLSQHLCSPIEGHLDAVYRIFIYLQKNLGKNPGRMAYDPMYEPTEENFLGFLEDI